MPVGPITTERGWRDQAEMAEFLALSVSGFHAFQRSRGNGLYGPKYLRKSENGVPAGAYTDTEVAEWMLRRSMSELAMLAFHQHAHPSKPMRPEVEALMRSFIEAKQLAKK